MLVGCLPYLVNLLFLLQLSRLNSTSHHLLSSYQPFSLKKKKKYWGGLKELMLLNCGVGEDSWESLGDSPTSSPIKEIHPVHPKGDQSWVFIGRTDAKAETPILWPPDAEELTHLKRPWCWERLRAGGEGDDRGWDGWMASLTQWTWVWVNCGSWWWTGRPGVLRFMGSQRVGHDWATELNWT